MKMLASDHALARLIEKQQKSACSVSLVSLLNKNVEEIFQRIFKKKLQVENTQ